MIVKWIATILTYVVALPITLIVALLSLLLARPTQALYQRMGWNPLHNPFEWVAYLWNSFVVFLYRHVLRMQLMWHNTAPGAAGEYVLYIPNHGGALEMMLWAWYATAKLNKITRVVIDVGNLANPIGWALKGIGGIFVNRKRSGQAKQVIYQKITEDLAKQPGPCTYIVCPDMGRPKPASIERDREKFPWAIDWIGPVCFPRAGGFEEALKALQDAGVDFRVVTATVAIGADQNIGVWQLHRLFGSTIHISAIDVTDRMPDTPAERRLWLEELWQKKAVAINCWRTYEWAYSMSPGRVLVYNLGLALVLISPFFW